MIERFFVITTEERLMPASLYEVRVMKESRPVRVHVEKIDFRGRNKVSIGHKFEALKVAICERIIGFEPSDSTTAHSESEFMRGYTMKIIALFSNEHDARNCFYDEKHDPYDPRWLGYTKKMISEIGMNHPNLFIEDILRLKLFDDQS